MYLSYGSSWSPFCTSFWEATIHAAWKTAVKDCVDECTFLVQLQQVRLEVFTSNTCIIYVVIINLWNKRIFTRSKISCSYQEYLPVTYRLYLLHAMWHVRPHTKNTVHHNLISWYAKNLFDWNMTVTGFQICVLQECKA